MPFTIPEQCNVALERSTSGTDRDPDLVENGCVASLRYSGMASGAMMSSESRPDVYLINPTFNAVQGDQINVTHDDRRSSIHRWLAAPNPSSNHRAACKKRQPDTGNWFIKGDLFAKWKTVPSFFFWLHGCPGCGKTILSSNIIQDVTRHCEANPSSAIAYFYFDFQDREKQHCQNLLRSLITQFSNQCTSTPEALERLYSRGQEPDLDDHATTLNQVLQEFQQSYIIVDALDECTERETLLKLIEDIVDWKMNTLHIFVTSRKEREIEDCLALRVSHQVDIQENVIARDIEIHIRERLRNDQRLKKWPKKVQEEIEAKLTEGAHGMFRWVACQLDELRKCAKLSELRNALKCLPQTLDDTYERILVNIDILYRKDVQTVLQWLCFSLQPVRLDEMVEVLAVTFEDGTRFDPDERYADPRDILTRCTSLVSVSSKPDDEGVLRLAHFSVKEYLVSDRIRNSRARMYSMVASHANVVMAQSCLAYLLQFKSAICQDSSTIKNYPLSRYAARFWIEHTQFHGNAIIDDLLELIMELFQMSDGQHYTPQFVTWVQIHDIDGFWDNMKFDRPASDIPSPLYYAALEGMLPIVQAILRQGQDANGRGGAKGCAVQAASSKGYEEIVQLLLEHGGNVNAHGGEYGCPLFAASYKGHERIVELLLDHGADINVQNDPYGSVLQAASSRTHEKIVTMLLERGADVNAKAGYLGYALHAAAFAGHEGIVKLLLEHGTDVNARGGPDDTALQAASYIGHKGIVKLLLDHGADVNAWGGRDGSAIQAASSECYSLEIVELLLEHGADVNAPGGRYGSALQEPSAAGHEKLVKLLLEHGADVNAHGGTALLQASLGGHEAVVKLLLEHDPDVGIQGYHFGRALQRASHLGHEGIVKLLLEHGADVNADRGYHSPLGEASIGGHAVNSSPSDNWTRPPNRMPESPISTANPPPTKKLNDFPKSD